MCHTEIGCLVGRLNNIEELFRIDVPISPHREILTAHFISELNDASEVMFPGFPTFGITQTAAFIVEERTKLIVCGVDQPVVNLDYSNWPTFEAGSYAMLNWKVPQAWGWIFLYAKMTEA